MQGISLALVVVSPLMGATALASFGRNRPKLVRAITAASLGVPAILVAIIAIRGLSLPVGLRLPWIPLLPAHVSLCLDHLSLPFVLNLLVVSLAATVYAWGYTVPGPRAHLFHAGLVAFSACMLGILLSEDALLLLFFWEYMLIVSVLLLLGWGQGASVRRVTLVYFVYSQMGTLVLMGALAWMGFATKSLSLQAWATLLPAHFALGPRTVLLAVILVAFGVKMAIPPLHGWLPDAHAVAPMPLTVLLAAAMLSMGAYGMARFAPLMGIDAMASIQALLMAMGLAAEFYGGYMCLRQMDIKRVVAYSSVSQMGYVLFGLASLDAEGVTGSILHIISHGVLKALLFMAVGLVIRATGERRLDRLGGLYRSMPRALVMILLATMALAGVPPMLAFHSEWLLLAGELFSRYPAFGYLAFAAPLLTAAYGLRLAVGLAFGPPPETIVPRPTPATMRWSTYALAAIALLLGLVPQSLYRLAEAAARVVLGGGSA